MELDLRSFIPPHTDGDDADDGPHRTIDEILNECDTSSSSSSPSPSPPSSPKHTSQPGPVSFSRVKPAQLPNPTRAQRPLSSLLDRIRPNAKPGAALPAAAAASRAVPTPHAAAIMSRRRVVAADSGSSIAGDDDGSDVSSKGELGEK